MGEREKIRSGTTAKAWLTALMIAGAGILGALALSGTSIPGLSLLTSVEPTKLEIRSDRLTTPRSLILGNNGAEFSLVMFGDYECPPCKGKWPFIASLQRRHYNKLSVYFRHLPLTSIHTYAFPAAVVAESSKLSGSGNVVHEALYASLLSGASIERIRVQYHVSDDRQLLKQASKRVLEDMNLANSLNLRGTPCFFLIHNGEVFLLSSVDQIEKLIR